MLDVVEKVRRVGPHSLLLLAAIGVKQAEHQGIDPFKEWDEGVTLPTELDPLMKMAANLVSDQAEVNDQRRVHLGTQP